MRELLVVLGDQLDRASSLFSGGPSADRVVLFAEVAHEAERLPNHVQRVVLFLSAMRHFADELRAGGWTVDYRSIRDTPPDATLASVLDAAILEHGPAKVRITEPGEWGVEQALRGVCAARNVPLEMIDDRHFFSSRAAFAEWARGKKQLRMEHFYRHMRRVHRILLDDDGAPIGGEWNYDAANREAFGRGGPPPVPAPLVWDDAITRETIADVRAELPGLAGTVGAWMWPVTPAQARAVLDRFVEHALVDFGRWQDAMWTGEATLFHSLVSTSLNLKLLDPRDVIDAAVRAWEGGAAPIEAVEGFVRQVIGWREFIRGVYWLHMPSYADHNALEAHSPLPQMFWDGQTEMRCMREVVGQLLATGYAHHIQRLMVAGLFSQLLGVKPEEIQRWFMGYFVDSVEWVTLPNVVGMSQFADGGIVGSKPYVATGKYVARQSNYCAGCAYDPGESTGDRACPITTLYWAFLEQHEDRFRSHPRMALQVKNLARRSIAERAAVRARAEVVRQKAADGTL